VLSLGIEAWLCAVQAVDGSKQSKICSIALLSRRLRMRTGDFGKLLFEVHVNRLDSDFGVRVPSAQHLPNTYQRVGLVN
jgi:hypothetical protein